jgi:hypothetical protein
MANQMDWAKIDKNPHPGANCLTILDRKEAESREAGQG